jgi:hypothetical protein
LLVIVWCGSIAAALGQAPPQTRGLKPTDAPPASTIQAGSYYALVIGINDYKYLPKLQTALNDATEVARVLQHNYGFIEPKVMLNPTRDEVLTQFNVFRRTLPENSNLLIYYAGHGIRDRDTGKAYWLPVDAERDSDVNWISSSSITEEISALRSSHVLVISDSCYSGALTRGVDIEINPIDDTAYLKKMLGSRSRTLMASGGNEPVADGGGAGHSKFASVLLESLTRRVDKDRFTAGYLFERYIQPWVSGQSDQSPQYSPIQSSGHEYGDFVFSRLSDGSLPIEPPIADRIIPARDTQLIPSSRTSVNRDDDEILAALHRYTDAYESMDINDLKAVWPTISKDQIKDLKTGFSKAQAVKVELKECGPATATGDNAKVSCTQSMVYTMQGRRQQPQLTAVDISLKKHADGKWAVDEVKSR